MTIVYYVESFAGSGKTYTAVRHTHYLAQQGHKVLFVQPSVLLIQQTLADLASLMPRCPVPSPLWQRAARRGHQQQRRRRYHPALP